MKFKPDPSAFRYTTSFDTDLRKTFARIRETQRQAPEKAIPAPAAPVHVASIARSTAVAAEHSDN